MRRGKKSAKSRRSSNSSLLPLPGVFPRVGSSSAFHAAQLGRGCSDHETDVPFGKDGVDAMKKEMEELQQLKGIGKVLSRRLIEASYNTIAKVAAAEEHGLKRIPGMNPQKVRSIVAQARGMTSEAEKSRPKTWKH